MKKKDEIKKTVKKAAGNSKPAKEARIQSANAKVSAKKPRKPEAPIKTKVTFKLEAPQAEQVSVAGTFNEWNSRATILERDENGAWMCTLVIDPGEYEYRFFVDGQWCDDLSNMLRRPNGFGTENCVLIV